LVSPIGHNIADFFSTIDHSAFAKAFAERLDELVAKTLLQPLTFAMRGTVGRSCPAQLLYFYLLAHGAVLTLTHLRFLKL